MKIKKNQSHFPKNHGLYKWVQFPKLSISNNFVSDITSIEFFLGFQMVKELLSLDKENKSYGRSNNNNSALSPHNTYSPFFFGHLSLIRYIEQIQYRSESQLQAVSGEYSHIPLCFCFPAIRLCCLATLRRANDSQ